MSANKPYTNVNDIRTSISLPGFAKHVGPDGENVLWTSDPSVELPIKMNKDPNHTASLAPSTVVQVFRETVAAKPNFPALRVERDGKWVEWDFLSYYNECRAFAKGLINIGLKPHECINIIGFNAPEWFMADVGAIFAGGIAAGIYTSNGPEACFYVANHSQAKVIVVENDIQLQKILTIRDRLPNLTCIVQYIGTPPQIDGVLSWKDFLALGQSVSDEELDARMDAQQPGNCCTLIYTSGTTGQPKAVMLSHDNITWTAKMCNLSFDINDRERIISYLPLSHIAAQLTELHAPLKLGGCVFFARPDALQGSLVATLQAVRPTIFFGVPRVWEKIEEKMRAVGAANTGLKKAMGDWAKQLGLRSNLDMLDGKEAAWGFTLADKLVFHNVKKALGLDEARILLTGAAPIALKTLHYFLSLNMQVRELYGMSESTGPHSWNREGETRIGSVGKVMMGAELALSQPTDKDGNGEILMRGRHVFMGYMRNPDATRKDIDRMGYLHTGDLGKIDEDGFLYITGRIKELIITAGGENIPPVLIEDAIKARCDALSYAVLIGDQRKYLSMLFTLKTEPDANGQPTNTLMAPVIAWAKRNGSSATTVTEAMADSKFLAGIQKAIDSVNAEATSRAQRVQKFTVLPSDFTQESGELTPTMKLKRRIVSDKFSEVIEAMYPPKPIQAKL